MALTLSQKILARTSGGPAPQPGDIVVARVEASAQPAFKRRWPSPEQVSKR